MTDDAEDKTAGPSDRINEYLHEKLQAAEAELAQLRQLLGRPINVNIQGPEDHVLKQIGQYLPQLTHLTSNVATIGGQMIQAHKTHEAILGKLGEQNTLLDRIARSLEHSVGKPGKPDPEDRSVGNTPGRMNCRCDGPRHAYTPGWCPPGGPVQ